MKINKDIKEEKASAEKVKERGMKRKWEIWDNNIYTTYNKQSISEKSKGEMAEIEKVGKIRVKIVERSGDKLVDFLNHLNP